MEIPTTEKLVKIPLLGTIAAGEPIYVFEEQKETVVVQQSLLSKSGEHYALKVAGDSMMEEGIFDGDVVVIRKQPTAENGETVVALINNEKVTLKKIFKEKGRFRLQPANPAFKPIFTKRLVIQGKVVSIIRNFGELKKRVEQAKEFTNATLKYLEETELKYRKSLGQYFTPCPIREALIKNLPNNLKNPKVLDPGCGTGEFLLTAQEYFKNPKLYGWDIDKKMVDITKSAIPNANTKKLDALLNSEYGKYDVVIGNPPYFEFIPSEQIRKKFNGIINGRANIFSLFICQGLNWLKTGGYLAYVVPPSMNNGAYFAKLRQFIVENSNIEYLKILDDAKLFNGAQQSTMLLILKKVKNKGDYVFRKNGILIFSEKADYLEKNLKDKLTFRDLNYEVKTGRLVWNQNKHLLTNNPKGAVPLIWARNITSHGLKLPLIKEDKPQYVMINNCDNGPAIVVNRITGSVKTTKLRAAIVPSGMKFIAENHVNVIFPPLLKESEIQLTLEKIVKQLISEEKLEVVKNITGNTQISKNELEKLFPISI